jgi:FKBP-type peptidyl-prolyl cis-trans isomerase
MMLKMTLKWIAFAAGVLLLTAQARAGEAPDIKTMKDQMSYSVGADLGRNLKRQGVEINMDALIKGFRDAFSGGKSLLSETDFRVALAEFQAQVELKRAALRKAVNENKAKGEAFLAKNGKKEGVVILASGLQYKILKAGNGPKPTDADTVECRYRGALLNGTVFDSSERGGQPAALLEVKSLIPGCNEALKLMPVGSTWQLFIPSALGYGAQGLPPDIGPNETLIFEMEVLAIK